MKLSKARYDAIDQMVYQLLMDFDPNGFPFDIVSIAKWMGINVCAFSSLEEEKRDLLLENEKTSTGFYICDRRGAFPLFWIFYNDGLETGRWLFTIAHEIGHIVLRHGSNPTSGQESEADYFAKQLMAPRCLAVAKKMSSPRLIHDTFCLSWEAATYLAEYVDRSLMNCDDRLFENDTAFLQWCDRRGWLMN